MCQENKVLKKPDIKSKNFFYQIVFIINRTIRFVLFDSSKKWEWKMSNLFSEVKYALVFINTGMCY